MADGRHIRGGRRSCPGGHCRAPHQALGQGGQPTAGALAAANSTAPRLPSPRCRRSNPDEKGDWLSRHGQRHAVLLDLPLDDEARFGDLEVQQRIADGLRSRKADRSGPRFKPNEGPLNAVDDPFSAACCRAVAAWGSVSPSMRGAGTCRNAMRTLPHAAMAPATRPI